MTRGNLTLCADGGGSKLQLLLADESLSLCASASSGPVNGTFPEEVVREQIRAAVASCTRGVPQGAIGCAVLSAPDGNDAARLFFEEVRAHSPQACVRFLSEGRACLLAGTLSSRGIVTLSGTGSGVFFVDGEEEDHLGGWGCFLGDFGSGYVIGQRGLQAAIRAEEGWGEQTALVRLARAQYGVERLWELLPLLYRQPFPVKKIASFCRSVGEAADAGDRAALRILREAARELAEQTKVMLRRHPGAQEAVVSGGSWKCSRRLFQSFAALLSEEGGDVRARLPEFEPVVGGVILALRERGCADLAEFLPRLREELAPFRYRVGRAAQGGEAPAQKGDRSDDHRHLS